ncbi:MAG: hypothetical protein RL199_157 [Pseudomonadota bacterium]|jgi:hypothetical protein
MPHLEPEWRHRSARWLHGGVALLLCVEAWLLWEGVRHGAFDCDDFQHAHLAWLTLRGGLIYRDFFDNHGPLSAWLNALALGVLRGRVVSFDAILWLRMLVGAAVVAQGALVHRIASRLTGSGLAGLTAVVLLGSSYLLQTRGTMLRPDALQNAVLLGALACLLEWRALAAGLLLGLDLFLHFKGVLGIAAVLGASLAAGLPSAKAPPGLRETLRFHGRVLAGMLAVAALVCTVFAAFGALDDLWRDFVRYNLGETASRVGTGRVVTDITRGLFWKWFTKDAWLVGCGLAGLGACGFAARRLPVGRSVTLVGLATLFSLPVWTLPLYPQVCLVTLPLLALAAVLPVGLVSARGVGLVLGGLLLVAGGSVLARVGDRPDVKRALVREATFRGELEWIREADRSEPVVYFWPTHSAAHVFNANPDRRWMLPVDDVGGSYNSLVDEAHLETARTVEAQLLAGRMDWVVVDPGALVTAPPALQGLLETAFERRGSLWKRRSRRGMEVGE